MKTKKTPHPGAHSLEFFPVKKITAFAVVQSKVIIHPHTGGYKIPIVPGSLIPDVQEEEAEGGTVYRINHTFNIAFNCLENEQQLKVYAGQEMIATYMNETGQRVVSGTQQNPLTFSYIPVSGNYNCKLSGVTREPEAFL
mgnify:CR=1 FL=1